MGWRLGGVKRVLYQHYDDSSCFIFSLGKWVELNQTKMIFIYSSLISMYSIEMSINRELGLFFSLLFVYNSKKKKDCLFSTFKFSFSSLLLVSFETKVVHPMNVFGREKKIDQHIIFILIIIIYLMVSWDDPQGCLVNNNKSNE